MLPDQMRAWYKVWKNDRFAQIDAAIDKGVAHMQRVAPSRVETGAMLRSIGRAEAQDMKRVPKMGPLRKNWEFGYMDESLRYIKFQEQGTYANHVPYSVPPHNTAGAEERKGIVALQARAEAWMIIAGELKINNAEMRRYLNAGREDTQGRYRRWN